VEVAVAHFIQGVNHQVVQVAEEQVVLHHQEME
jgi:hypothetical protein